MRHPRRSSCPRIALALVLATCSLGFAQDRQRLAVQQHPGVVPATGSDPASLTAPISLRLHHVPLETALKEIARSARIPITFSVDIIPADWIVSLTAERMPVGEALRSVLSGTGLDLLATPSGHVAVVPTHGREALAELGFAVATPALPPAPRETTAREGGVPRQVATITGRVIDANTAEPLPGAQVAVVGSRFGATAGADGRYLISGVPAGSYRIRAQHVGYTASERELTASPDARITADFSLQPIAVGLEEIVVVGYGERRRRDLTGSVSSIRAEEIAEVPVTSAEQALQGRSPGVQVVQNEGKPGAGYTVRIRGGNSMLGGNEPLYVIDGFPVSPGGDDGRSILSALNANDIESIQILKDASATAIYGARGANGVVMITTKRGDRGTSRVEFETYTGIQSVTRTLELANATQFAELANELARNEGQALPFPDLARLPAQTDWQDEVFRDAPIQSYTLRALGGDEKTRYMISGNYLDQEGIIAPSRFQRGTVRLNLDRDLSDRLRLSNQIMLARAGTNDLKTSTATESFLYFVVAAPPTVPVFDEEGNYSSVTPYFFSPNNSHNPVAVAREVKDERTTLRLLGNVSAEYRFMQGLSAKVDLGADYLGSRNDYYATRLTNLGGTGGVGRQTDTEAISYVNQNTLTYSGSFGTDHRVEATGGFTAEHWEGTFLTAGASNFVTDALGNQNLGGGELISPPANGGTSWTLLSGLGRINYAFRDRYLFTASARRDGSSRFGSSNRWGFFPSVGVAWRVSEEPFLAGATALSSLKLRASWGRTGNQEIGLYNALERIQPVRGVLGNDLLTGFAPANIANPDLRWETTEQIDLGFDAGFLDERLRVTADAYMKHTSNLLARVNLPPSAGFGSVLQNVGSIRNRGVELAVGADLIRGSTVGWTLDANISANRNEVVELAGGNEFLGSSISYLFGPVHLMREGAPLSSFYTFVEDGLTDAGQVKYVDQNGDGRINDLDRVIVGDPYPDYTFGVNSTLRYGPFDLTAFLQGVQGVHLYNVNLGFIGGSLARGENVLAEVYRNHWSVDNPNPNAKYPKLSTRTSFRPSDRFVEDASYVRLKNLTLGYDLPVRRMGFGGFESARLYVSAQNLLTLTDYSWYDPEVSAYGGDDLRLGTDQFSYPHARTYTVGLRVGL